MDALSLLLVIVALVAGAAIGWFAHATRTARDAADARASLAARDAETAALRLALEREEDLRRDAIAHAQTERAAADERARRESAVLTALSPVRESLHRMQQRVDEMERERHSQFGTIAEQLRRAHASDEALRATTESLAGALRSTTARGVWGETQLRRVVESAGLVRHVDFDTQAVLTGDDVSGRPDMVVRLPGDKSIAIDAKAPLDAFLDAAAIPDTVAGDDARRRRELLKQHVKAVRGHVDALARKAYWAGLPSSPEFVVCFLPSESILSVALDEDPTLLEYAFSKRVALASPVNLFAVLKTVAYAWTQQEVSDEARTLFTLGNQLYERLGTLAQHAGDLRRAIERTVDSYNKFAGSLESRVLVTARQFPGIDETKLTAMADPQPLHAPVRRLAAPELLDGLDDRPVAERAVTESIAAQLDPSRIGEA
ncbi:DNA recombination protein RmuC [Microbacterium stercoris]|uniref:DNA recombination protein RmuC n=1 Tax=Microbacterium stercoris TaxID=2820289 RepID=A0A939QG25_9MICO|nr:DNA recombination protein RmuC [Microbacterium stercoris]MBO3662257.1 DNA recombination protein RmuC [Microbacterium stercoris]